MCGGSRLRRTVTVVLCVWGVAPEADGDSGVEGGEEVVGVLLEVLYRTHTHTHSLSLSHTQKS